jgi:hypothetical protein
MRALNVLMFASALVASLTGSATADLVRYRYVARDASGNPAIVPIGPGGALGEYQTWIGAAPQPFNTEFRPTHMAAFRHPCSGQCITVPLALPDSTPRVEHRADRIVHNYGSYTVEAIFLNDGSVEVVYNSGFLRPLRVQ